MRALMVIALSAGCTIHPLAYQCTSSSQCGSNGVCVDGACALASTSCQSGFQFDPSASSGRGGKCTDASDMTVGPHEDLSPLAPDLAAVDLAGASADLVTELPDLLPPPDMAQPIVSFDVVASPTLVNEHQSFNLHLTARTTGNAILTSYTSGATLAADWGDVTVITPPVFVNGQADATVMLNRETNPTNGLAHVTAADSVAVGQSQGITVNAPAWTISAIGGFSKGAPGAWDDTLIRGPSMVLVSGTYYLFYEGSGTPSTPGIGRATSTDLANWTRSAGPVFVASASGWDQSTPAFPGVQWDGNHFVMSYWAVSTQNSGGLATSNDGLSWTRPAAPMVTPDAVPACGKIEDSGIWVESPGHYTALAFANTGSGLVICELSSSDGGSTWPIASVRLASGLDNGGHYMAAFIKDGSVYRFWHYGHYYTSTDAKNWVLSPTDPLSPYPRTVLWNAAKNRYEGLTDAGTGSFALVTRP